MRPQRLQPIISHPAWARTASWLARPKSFAQGEARLPRVFLQYCRPRHAPMSCSAMQVFLQMPTGAPADSTRWQSVCRRQLKARVSAAIIFASEITRLRLMAPELDNLSTHHTSFRPGRAADIVQPRKHPMILKAQPLQTLVRHKTSTCLSVLHSSQPPTLPRSAPASSTSPANHTGLSPLPALGCCISSESCGLRNLTLSDERCCAVVERKGLLGADGGAGHAELLGALSAAIEAIRGARETSATVPNHDQLSMQHSSDASRQRWCRNTTLPPPPDFTNPVDCTAPD